MKEIFLEILRMSASGSVVILAVLFARLCLRRCPKKVTILLWLPAALRLLCPLSLPSPVSLFNLIRPAALQTTGLTASAAQYVPDTAAVTAETTVATVLSAAEPVSSLPDTAPAVDPAQLWQTLGTFVWCAGIAVMVVWAAVQYIRLRRRMRTAVLAEGARNVYQSENAASPFILGVFRPKIYIPYRLNEDVKRQVLLHERTHLRCGDHLTKILAFGILTLHWFNPLCWLAFALFGRDIEMRCDEAVLARSDVKEYSTALVMLAAEKRYSVTGPLAFGETSVKERVKHILHWKKPALWITIAAVLLCVLVIVVCATDVLETPYEWTSTITAEDLTRRTVTYYGTGVYEAELTDAQLEELAECLRNVPETAMYIGKNITNGKKSIHYTVENKERGIFLLWDGEHVIQRPVVYHFTIQPTWYLEDSALENFFAELEKNILAGQGTLIEDSVPVSVSGSDTMIAPKKYTAGTWEHNYDELPVLIMSESGHLCIHVYWQPENLYVYEEYYDSISEDAAITRRTTYTAAGPHADGGYTIEVTRINPKLDEKAIYYITNGDEKYIFKVEFPAYNTDLPIVGIEESLIREEAAGKYTTEAAVYGTGMVERIMTRLRDEEGLSFKSAKITGMERMNTGTAGLYVTHVMIRIDYALLPADGTELPDTVITEDGWITGYTPEGSSYLVMTDTGTEILYTAETCETAIQQTYSEQDKERYGNPYTACTMHLVEAFQAPADADFMEE